MQGFNRPGMGTYMDQNQDRSKWEKSIQLRRELIDYLTKNGRRPKHPDNLSIKELQKRVRVVLNLKKKKEKQLRMLSEGGDPDGGSHG